MHFTDERNWPHRVRQHNLVYRTPALDPVQGWPIGSGHLGALVWLEADALVCVVNRCDLWQDGPPGPFRNWKPEEEEHSTALKHGGRLVFRFDDPVFDLAWLRDFHAGIDLTSGALELAAHSVFGDFELTCFAAEGTDAVRFRWHWQSAENSGIRLRLERYGSRTFAHWYRQTADAPETGLDGTACRVVGDVIEITHPVSDGEFALALGADWSAPPEKIDRFAAAGGIADEGEAVLLLTAPGAAEHAAADLETERGTAFDDRLAVNRAAWKKFWSTSYMDCGDAYLDQAWHWTMYLLNSSQRGRYPGRFINGLWSWQRDYQAWDFYFHWNQQMLVWPVFASGHFELAHPYLAMRLAGLGKAKRDARAFFARPGAWVSDVTDRSGENSTSELGNHTPAAEIALDLYRYWQYTRDDAFLREKAFPYMCEAARFLASLAEKGADGVYRPGEATVHEGEKKVREAVTELTALRALLPAVLDAAEHLRADLPEATQYRELLARLTDFSYGEDLREFSDAEGRCGVEFFAGTPWRGEARLAAGKLVPSGETTFSVLPGKPRTPPVRTPVMTALRAANGLDFEEELTHDVAANHGIFPHAELAVVYPAGLTGIGKPGKLYDAAVNSALLDARRSGFISWSPEPVYLARLGLGREAFAYLDLLVARWQNHDNGMYTDSLFTQETLFPRVSSMVQYLADGKVSGAPRPTMTARFRHWGLEANGVLATALNEAMLQSYDGVILIAPAFPMDRSGAFTLWAEGGHRVSAKIDPGRIAWIALTLGAAGSANLRNPWETCFVNGEARSGEDIQLVGRPGTEFVLTPDEKTVPDFAVPVREAAPRTHAGGLARLGREKMF